MRFRLCWRLINDSCSCKHLTILVLSCQARNSIKKWWMTTIDNAWTSRLQRFANIFDEPPQKRSIIFENQNYIFRVKFNLDQAIPGSRDFPWIKDVSKLSNATGSNIYSIITTHDMSFSNNSRLLSESSVAFTPRKEVDESTFLSIFLSTIILIPLG